VSLIKVATYVLNGALVGLAACAITSRVGAGSPSVGAGLELEVVAAVVIGGASLAGGEGSLAGSFLGVLLLGAVSVALPLLGVSGFWQGAIYGAVILIALIVDRSVRTGGMRGLLGRDVA
jgi:rhamnose transport system permease protein